MISREEAINFLKTMPQLDSDMEPKGLKKKFDNRTFAANCNREIIKEIELTSIKLDELFSIAIESMKRIKAQIGLE